VVKVMWAFMAFLDNPLVLPKAIRRIFRRQPSIKDLPYQRLCIVCRQPKREHIQYHAGANDEDCYDVTLVNGIPQVHSFIEMDNLEVLLYAKEKGIGV